MFFYIYIYVLIYNKRSISTHTRANDFFLTRLSDKYRYVQISVGEEVTIDGARGEIRVSKKYLKERQ